MAVAMILFNLMLFVGGLRDVIYLMYVAFGSSVMLTIAARNGFAQSYLVNGQMMWSSAAVVIGFSLSFGTLMIFMRRMLNTNKVVPRFDRLLKILLWVLFLLPIPLLFALHTFIKVAAVTYAISALVIITTSISCAYLRQRSAYFFVVAFLCLVAGSLFAVFRAFGWLPTNVITVNGMQFGSVLEMLLLALALADRYNVLRREKDLAQLHAIAAQTQLVETLRSSERALEVRVAERTEELSNTISRLEQTQTELVQSAKLAALGSLVAAVAHELNTPIGNAVMTASALEDETKILSADFNSGKLHKSTLVKYLELAAPMASLVLKSCNRAADLIVSFKRVAVDQTSEKRRSFDLRALIDDNIIALWPSYKHQPWVVSVNVPEGIHCDSYPGPLGQVVVNLVQNAVAHAFVGRSEGHLEISAEQVNGTVKLRFTDNGHGMHPDILKNIFEPFFTTKLGQGGSGLGLSIVMNIVTGVLGGSIGAQSELGKGSSFTLTIPTTAPTKEATAEQDNDVCLGMP
jgi:signal transduction histidine kinase